jgi:hypothetical protein
MMVDIMRLMEKKYFLVCQNIVVAHWAFQGFHLSFFKSLFCGLAN